MGQSLLDEHQTGEVAFLVDTFWQAGNSNADILAALQANTLPVSASPPASVIAIRSAAYSEVTAVAQISTPVPAATEDADCGWRIRFRTAPQC
jgi:hypothetical protein